MVDEISEKEMYEIIFSSKMTELIKSTQSISKLLKIKSEIDNWIMEHILTRVNPDIHNNDELNKILFAKY